MAKKWYPELWKPLEIELDIPEKIWEPSKPHTFYDPKADNEGYEVYGINPTRDQKPAYVKRRDLKKNGNKL